MAVYFCGVTLGINKLLGKWMMHQVFIMVEWKVVNELMDIMGKIGGSGRSWRVVDNYFRKLVDQGEWFRIWLNKLCVYLFDPITNVISDYKAPPKTIEDNLINVEFLDYSFIIQTYKKSQRMLLWKNRKNSILLTKTLSLIVAHSLSKLISLLMITRVFLSLLLKMYLSFI